MLLVDGARPGPPGDAPYYGAVTRAVQDVMTTRLALSEDALAGR